MNYVLLEPALYLLLIMYIFVL